MKHIEKTVSIIEAFLSSNPDGEEGMMYVRQNIRHMYLRAMQNLEDEDKDRVTLMAESFLFVDELLESLQSVTAS